MEIFLRWVLYYKRKQRKRAEVFPFAQKVENLHKQYALPCTKSINTHTGEWSTVRLVVLGSFIYPFWKKKQHCKGMLTILCYSSIVHLNMLLKKLICEIGSAVTYSFSTAMFYSLIWNCWAVPVLIHLSRSHFCSCPCRREYRNAEQSVVWTTASQQKDFCLWMRWGLWVQW